MACDSVSAGSHKAKRERSPEARKIGQPKLDQNVRKNDPISKHLV